MADQVFKILDGRRATCSLEERIDVVRLIYSELKTGTA